MTLREYIQILQSCPDQDLRVVKAGYEGGYNDISGILTRKKVAINVNEEWYYGKHEDIGSYRVQDTHDREVVLFLS